MKGSIVFDLDGTLVDSLPDIVSATNTMLAQEGKPPLPAKTIEGFVGNGLPALVSRVIMATDLPTADTKRLTKATQKIYMEHSTKLSRVYDGVPEMLETLKQFGYSLGVCTNKPLAPALQILEGLGLKPYFDVVIGGDTLPVNKPDPAPLKAAFDALGGQETLFAGDSEVDAETALRGDFPFALFTQGYRKSPVADIPHHFSFDKYDDFVAAVLSDATF